MEKNLLQPTGEIRELFEKHFQNLMTVYGITDYMFLSNLDKQKSLIRGSPERISDLLFES